MGDEFSHYITALVMSPYYKSKISSSYRKVFTSTSYDECVLVMEDVYRMIKKSAATYYSGYEMSFLYNGFVSRLVKCESLLEGVSIIDSSPDFKYDNEYFERTRFSCLKNTREKLDYIVWCSRRNIVERFKSYYEIDVSLEDCFLVNECFTASVYTELLCDKLGVWCKTIKIPPAYTDEIKLYDGDGFHYFNIIKLDGYYFIVDCTYRQFFKLDNNLLDRLGVPKMNGCDVGVYMGLNASRESTASRILKKGWIIASPENVKNYLDGFTLSFRNGLYYENAGVVNYSVDYTLRDYKRFLTGKDNQINYESYNCLGVQDEPLEDYKLDFKIKAKKQV